MPSSQYDLSFIAKFVNKMSKGMTTAGRDVSKFGKTVSGAGAAARLAGNTISSLTGIALGLGSILGSGAAGLGTAAMKTSMEIDDAMGQIKASLDGTAKEADLRVRYMKDIFADLSMRIPIDVKDMAAAAVVGLKEFGDIPTIVDRVVKSVRSGFTGGGSPAHAMMSAGQIMHSFKDATEETFEYVITRMPMMARKANAGFDQFTRAIGRAAPLFADLGLSIPSFIGSFAEMTKIVGGRASIVGFQIAALMTSLMKFDDVKEFFILARKAVADPEHKLHGKNPWVLFLTELNKLATGSAKGMKKLQSAVGARGLVGLLGLMDPATIERLKLWAVTLDDTTKIHEYNVELTKKLMEGINDAGTQWKLMKNSMEASKEVLGFITKEALKPWFKQMNLELVGVLEYLRDIRDAPDITKKLNIELNFLKGFAASELGETWGAIKTWLKYKGKMDLGQAASWFKAETWSVPSGPRQPAGWWVNPRERVTFPDDADRYRKRAEMVAKKVVETLFAPDLREYVGSKKETIIRLITDPDIRAVVEQADPNIVLLGEAVEGGGVGY